MDEFHGIISSYQANRYVEEAIASQTETADVAQVPLFNGRHELLDSVLSRQSGQEYRTPVHDADMSEVEGAYGQTDTGVTAIEGNLFLKGKKPIVERISYGLGGVIKHTLGNDAKHVVISLGGIDSPDAGAGMLQALGAQFYDDEGYAVDVRQGAGVIKYIRRMDTSNLHPKMETARIQVMSDLSSRSYGKQSEIMQTYDAHQLNHNQAAEIGNLIWYFSELFKNELKIAIGPVERGGAGGGTAAVLSGLHQAEILTSYVLVDQLAHLENLVEQVDLIIFGEGLNENDQLLETTTLRIAELCHKHQKVAIAVCATTEKFDLFGSQGVTTMFNTFIDMPEGHTDFEMGLQTRHYTVQSLKLLKTHFNVEV